MSLAEVANEFAARYDRRTNFGNHKFMQTFQLRKLANTALMMYVSKSWKNSSYLSRSGGGSTKFRNPQIEIPNRATVDCI